MRSRVRRSRSTPTAPTTLLVAALALAVAPTAGSAQYFGRNKVQYEQFDFRVLQTPHFDVHFYPAESLKAGDAGRMAERWYARLSPLLRSTFDRRSLIFYANAPDFQQTNVVEGIGQGTGGVTESLRGRVVMPFQPVYNETDHVLGHELVHVFQYNIAFSGSGVDANAARGLSAMPLWVMEGMAEYLSVGRDDPLTAMWLRDAVRRNDIPTLRQLTRDPRYFPYRYGQAFWAWFAGVYGDAAVERVYRTALRQGWEPALRTVTGRGDDSLSAAWHRDIRAQFQPLLGGRMAPESTGTAIAVGGTRDAIANVSPVISPDGRYVAYFTSADLFGYSIFIADARTGRRIRRLVSATQGNAHFDAISFIQSAGSFSPDGRQFAFVVFAEGDEELNIYDVESGRVARRLRLSGVEAISDPAWSPDGSRVVVSGNSGGVTDLYLVDLATGRTEQLTTGRAAELQPAWSPDGRTIAYTTDQGPGYDPAQLTFGQMRLALFDLTTRQSRVLPGFGQGKHITPQFSPDGRELFFVAEPDGFQDVFRLVVESGELFRVTRTATGVSGITRLSPALSVARGDGRVVFSVFEQGGYSIRGLTLAEARGEPVAPAAVAARGGVLPPAEAPAGVVARYLGDPTTGLPAAVSDSVRTYRSRLSLDYIGVPQAGFGVGGPYGASVNGAVQAIWGDELNDRNVGAAVVAQGTLKDIGGQVFYLNRERRTSWLAAAGRTPILSLGYRASQGPVTIGNQTYNNGTVVEQIYFRQFFDEISGGVQYPFSTTRRVEFNGGLQRISYDLEADQLVYVGNQLADVRQGVGLEGPPSVTLGQASAALVGDYSFFGFTSPVAGGRYRFEVTPTFGDLTFTTATADYRRYFFLRPVTVAMRGLHYGRYGRGGDDPRLYPIFLGNPQFVRGYESQSFNFGTECGTLAGDPNSCPEIERLLGSRIAVASAELRIPLFGTRQFGLVDLPFLPTELTFFGDAGVAWSRGQTPRLAFESSQTTAAAGERLPVASAGVSTRVNVLGFAVVEFYYARPFQRSQRDWVFGFQLAPGW